MDTPYRDFAELTLYARRGVDYNVTVRDGGAAVTVAAIHAGHIEPLTGELATAIAGEDWNLYRLEGLRAAEAGRLRVPVPRFDDVRLTNLVSRAEVGLSLQGVAGEAELVHLGGGNRALLHALAEALEAAGFQTAGPATPGAAHSPARFVNKAGRGGVQLELTHALRRAMVDVALQGEAWREPAHRTARFHLFVRVVREALREYLRALAADLHVALEEFERATADIRRVIPLGDAGNGCHSGHDHPDH